MTTMPKYGDRVIVPIQQPDTIRTIRMDATVQSVDTAGRKVLVATDNGIWQWVAVEKIESL